MYIIVTQGTLGKVFMRKDSNRFTIEKDNATKFPTVALAKNWLSRQQDSMSKQLFYNANIISEF